MVVLLASGCSVMWGCSVRLDTDPYREPIPTRVMVIVTADDALAELVDVVRVEANDNTTDVPRNGRDIRGEDTPIRVPLSPFDAASPEQYQATVRLLDAEGRQLGVQTISGAYVKNELREVWVAFDSECELEACPDGFRCQEGQCVEHCVQSAELGTTTRSGPIACEGPCEGKVCANGNVLQCADGHYMVDKQCGFGCDPEADAACNLLVPSNVDEDFEWQTGLADLVVGEGDFVEVVFNTDDGSIIANPGTAGETEIRGPVEGEENGIVFEKTDGGTFNFLTHGGHLPFLAAYGVFSLDRLVVLNGATLRAQGSRSLILLAGHDVNIHGVVSVAATPSGPGAGGFRGGTDFLHGGGPGGGPGTTFVDVGALLFGGGGGASFGTWGGTGGRIIGDTGAFKAVVDPYGAPELLPLWGGSGGGAGAVDALGGHGGGAVQISTNGAIRIGVDTMIEAGGSGGLRGPGAGGGGSGGAILLEGKVSFSGDSNGVARVGAPGAGGGGIGDGSTSDGLGGHPHQIPAPGGAGFFYPSFGEQGAGGDGSSQSGLANTGGTWFEGGGGGGGGGGRIRVNTATGSERDALAPFVAPRSEDTFTVGKACTIAEPCVP